MWESQCVTIVMSGNCIVLKSSQLRCGGIAVWGSCNVEELPYGGVVVWRSCCVEELRLEELQYEEIAMWGSYNVEELWCGGVVACGGCSARWLQYVVVAVCCGCSVGGFVV